MKLTRLLIIKPLFPNDINVDSERSPSYSLQRDIFTCFWMEFKFAGVESWMKHNLHSFCNFVQRSFSFNRFHIKLPFILIVFVRVQFFCIVTNEESNHDSFIDLSFLRLNYFRVESHHFVPKIYLRLDMIEGEFSPAKWTFFGLTNDS